MRQQAIRMAVTERLDFLDHRAMAAWWGRQAATAIRRAIECPDWRTINDLDLEQAVRAARMSAWHALKVRRRARAS